MRLRTHGFTLIEIAVVLIVTGIILTGVVVTAQSVIRRAKVASLLTSIKDLATASRDFKSRYSYFPGDLPNAGTYITGNGGISTGCIYSGGLAGDGLVDTATESSCALEHLVKAGLLSKLQYNSGNGQYSIAPTIAPSVQVSLGFYAVTNENAIQISNLPCDVALEIDSKLDSDTGNNTPFLQGSVIADGTVTTSTTDKNGVTTTVVSTNVPIPTCTPAGTNDPVPTLLIKY